MISMFYFCICVFKKLELFFGGTWNAEREGLGRVKGGEDLHNFLNWVLFEEEGGIFFRMVS